MPNANNLFDTIDQNKWSLQRRATAHAFSASSLRAEIPVMEQVISRWFNHLDAAAESGASYKFDEAIIIVVFDIISQVSYGLEFNALDNPHGEQREFLEISARMLPEILLQALNPLRKYSSKPEVKQLARDKDRLTEIARKFRSERKASIQAESGLKGMSEILDDIEGLSEDDLLSNFTGFVIGGLDNTAHGISFTLYHLLTNPEEMAKCVAEVDELIPGGNSFPDSNQHVMFPYLAQCLKESWRIHPPGTGTARILDSAKTIDGISLDKGSIVAIWSVPINYNPKVWPEPGKFIPDRFTKEAEAARSKASFFTFSHGPRNCLGRQLAQLKSLMILAALLKRYTFKLAPDYKLVWTTGFSSKPLHDLPLFISRR